jgi:DNA-binding beta-propeller fold protein YncE
MPVGFITAGGAFAFRILLEQGVVQSVIDPETGETISIGGNLARSSVFVRRAETSQPRTPNTLYLIDSSTSTLFTVDPATGTRTDVGVIPFTELSGLGYDRINDKLYTFDNATQQLILLNKFTGSGIAIGPLNVPGILAIPSLTFGPGNALYGIGNTVSNATDLIRFDTATGQGTAMHDPNQFGEGHLTGLAYDPEGDRMYATSRFGSGVLWEYDPATAHLTILQDTVLAGIGYLADQPGTEVLWATRGRSFPPATELGTLNPTLAPSASFDLLQTLGDQQLAVAGIEMVALSGPAPGPNIGDLISIPLLSGGIGGVAVEADGTTALIAEGSGELSRVDLATGRVSTIARVSSHRLGSVAIEAGGATALVLASSGLARVNLETGAVETIVESGLNQAAGLAIEPGGSSALVTSLATGGGLSRVDLGTGEVTQISLLGGAGLAIEPGGATALVASGQEVRRIDLATGTVTTLVRFSFGGGPTGIAIEPSGITALVITAEDSLGPQGRIYRLNLGTGAFSELAICPACTGLPQIVMEPSGDTALYLGQDMHSLIRFNTSTFDHTVLARADSPRGLALSADGSVAYTASRSLSFLGQVSRVRLSTGQIDRLALTGSVKGGIGVNTSETTAFITAARPGESLIQAVDLLAIVDQTDPFVLPPRALDVASVPALGPLAIEGSEITALVITGFQSMDRVDLTSGTTSLVSDQLMNPAGLAIEEDGVSALVTEGRANGSLSRVDLTTGAVTPIATDLVSQGIAVSTAELGGVALEPDGEHALVAGARGLAEVNLTTGVVTFLTALPCTVTQPAAVVMEASGGTALVSHPICGFHRVRLAPSQPDTDGDGIPDAYELANGLNPNDPSDASQDPDFDGLTNLEEFQKGTDLRKADTDEDGVDDGPEVDAGTDPLDPTSFPIPEPAVTLIPDLLEFENVMVDVVKDLEFTIQNTGEAILSGSVATSGAPFSVVTGDPLEVPATHRSRELSRVMCLLPATLRAVLTL